MIPTETFKEFLAPVFGEISHLADSMPQLVWIADPEGNVVYYNSRVEEFAGAKKEADGRWSWHGLLHDEDLVPTVDAWTRALETATVYEIEHRVRMKDGSFKWHLSRGYPQKNEEGQVIRWFGTATNIHQQKWIGDQISEAEERWRTALEATEIGTWDFNPQTRAMYLSDVAKKIRGIDTDPQNFFEQNTDSVHPDDKEYVRSWIPTLLASGEGKTVTREYRILKQGAVRWIRSVGRVFFDATGNPQRAIGTMQDVTEEKNADEKLHYLAALTNNIADAVIGTDMNHCITSWNRGAEKIYGWTKEEVLGRKAREILQTSYFSDEEQPKWKEALDRDGFWQGEVLQKRKDGTSIYILTSIAYVKNDRGQSIGGVGVNKDITAQHAADLRLKESEERYATTVYASDLGLWDYDLEQQRFTVSGKMAAIYGVSSNEVFTILDALDAVHPEDKDHVLRVYATIMEGKIAPAFLVENRIIHQASGGIKWIRSKGRAFFDESGKLYRTVGTVADITLQKESEQKLKSSEEQFRLLTNTIPQVVWISAANGMVQYLNEQWTHLTGQPTEEGLENWREMIHPDDLPELLKNMKASIEAGLAFGLEFRLKLKDPAGYKWYYCNMQPMKDRDGVITKWIGASTDIQVFKDISVVLEQEVKERTNELNQANHSLKEQADELKRSNEDLQQFAHVASHDLKEPLRKIKTYGSRLEEEFGGMLPQQGRFYLSKMQSAAARMAQMIDGVLAYSMLPSIEQNMETIDLDALLLTIEEDLEMMAGEKNATIHHENLPDIEGVSILIYQLFYNLLHNALKFSINGRPPVIRISGSVVLEEKPFALITVRDNGIGFNERQAEVIFKTFTRLHTKDKYEGTGLGLSLCKKIVQQHGGTIEARGVLDEGASFIIRLPLRSPAAKAHGDDTDAGEKKFPR